MSIFDRIKSNKIPDSVSKNPQAALNRLDAAKARPWMARLEEEAESVRPFVSRMGARGPDGKFLPGATSNPGGRPLGPVAVIAYLTNFGEEMLVHALQTLRGEVRSVEEREDPLTGEVTRISVGPSIKDQAEARKFLSDRFWGKAAETVKIEDSRDAGSITIPPESIPPEVLQWLIRVETPAPIVNSGAVVLPVTDPKADS
jgi:hypothetical protein